MKRLLSAFLLVAVGGVAGAVAYSTRAPRGGPAVNANATSVTLATIQRRQLTAQVEVSGTLGYSGNYTVINEASGHYTWLPSVGQLVNQGGVLYQVDGAPVVLLYGSTPAYRALQEGEMGPDVAELNADLVALGYASRSQLNPTSNKFGSSTTSAVKRLQAALGVTQNGILAFGEAVFMPGAVRLTAVEPTLGTPAQPGSTVATATSTSRRVVVNLDATQQSEVKVGDQVTITLPNNQTTPGTVTFVSTVATSGGSSGGGGGSNGGGSSSSGGSGGGSTPTVEVDITPTNAAATGTLDAAPVLVTITTASTPDALAVPVTALLAVVGGGYEIEVVDSAGHHRFVSVQLGLFDDAEGLVQVTGDGLAAGQRVVVAGT